jgi:hypothetical protein
MPLTDWIYKYPRVQRLLQQQGADVEDGAAGAPERCAALVVTWDGPAHCWSPPTPCAEPVEQVAPDGSVWCVEHFERFWIHPCCGLMRTEAIPRPYTWDDNNEMEYWGSPYCWCDACTAIWDAPGAQHAVRDEDDRYPCAGCGAIMVSDPFGTIFVDHGTGDGISYWCKTCFPYQRTT